MTLDLLYSVEDLFKKYSTTNKYFNIPEYQRGYKWSKKQIEQLLNDVNDFFSEDEDKFYCLQNITLIDQTSYFNVVDGQQRLTTLVILLSALGKNQLVKDKLRYSIRDSSQSFLAEYIVGGKLKPELNDWNDFLQKNPQTDFDHQDIFYFFESWKSINEWLKNHDSDVFCEKLLHSVKLIVNVPQIENEQELFTNLNSGKVSLDGADLVRAQLITHVLQKLDLNDREKSLVLQNEQRVRIGMDIDDFSLWWTQKNHRAYFDWLEEDIKTAPDSNIDFDQKNYPSDLLYKLYALVSDNEQGNGKNISLRLFEKNQNEIFFELKQIQRTIIDWHKDVELYHYVRYFTLYGQGNKKCDNFKFVWNLWKKSKSREEVKNAIIKKMYTDCILPILEDLEDKGKNFESLEKLDWYNVISINDFVKFYVLLDIIKIVKSHNSQNPLPYLLPEDFKASEEDREHIFPQTPISDGDINRSDKKELRIRVGLYLDFLNETFKQNASTSTLVDLNDSKDFESLFQNFKNHSSDSDYDWENLKKKINEFLEKYIKINSMGNMCLLNQEPNRKYGNAFFTEKRNEILLQFQQGKHIRVHTLNCFNKVFSNTGSIESWGNDDIDKNAKNIIKTLQDFFSNIED